MTIDPYALTTKDRLLATKYQPVWAFTLVSLASQYNNTDGMTLDLCISPGESEWERQAGEAKGWGPGAAQAGVELPTDQETTTTQNSGTNASPPPCDASQTVYVQKELHFTFKHYGLPNQAGLFIGHY